MHIKMEIKPTHLAYILTKMKREKCEKNTIKEEVSLWYLEQGIFMNLNKLFKEPSSDE